jgi:hypothetical protein
VSSSRRTKCSPAVMESPRSAAAHHFADDLMISPVVTIRSRREARPPGTRSPAVQELQRLAASDPGLDLSTISCIIARHARPMTSDAFAR